MATLIDNPKRARQLARAIASDLTLYHEPKILEGIANDSLFEATPQMFCGSSSPIPQCRG